MGHLRYWSPGLEEFTSYLSRHCGTKSNDRSFRDKSIHPTKQNNRSIAHLHHILNYFNSLDDIGLQSPGFHSHIFLESLNIRIWMFSVSKTPSLLPTHWSSATILFVFKLLHAEASCILYSENIFYVAGNKQTLPNIFIDTVLADSAMITSLSFDLAGICCSSVDDSYAPWNWQVLPLPQLAENALGWDVWLQPQLSFLPSTASELQDTRKPLSITEPAVHVSADLSCLCSIDWGSQG